MMHELPEIKRVVTTFHEGSVLHLRTEMRDPFADVLLTATNAILDTEEKAIRDELIRMGWTPPLTIGTSRP